MNIIIVGLNHRTAPIEIREKLTFPADVIGDALKKLVKSYGANEGVILSTCNRVEVISVYPEVEKGVWEIKRFLSEHHNIPLETLDEHLYAHTGEAAVKHLFRVAAGLDSMVMGEPQILGQAKDAYSLAIHNNTAGVIVNKLFHKAFSAAKRVRTETKIGASAVSVSFAAVELAKKIFGNLRDKAVMLVGAGEMAELAATHLLSNGVREIVITNRTYERAVEMAREFNGVAVMFREFLHYLKNVDIVIASTAAANFIIRPDDVTAVMKERKHRPMFFIDISVPRNIDPLVNNIDNAYVFDIDDLAGVVEANIRERKKEAGEAEVIVEEEIKTFYRWVNSLDVVPTIIALKQNLERIRKQELEKALSELEGVSEKDRVVLEKMTSAIIQKVLHKPLTHLKREAKSVEGDFFIEATRKLFDLEEEEAIKKTKNSEE
ncbi:MAG TPA: glutamyl-tRNA reductase [Thermodesulfobacteriota bacterium]|nr:glutamyl-tRNA reductase [Thermodesulfobacteriota bacterium]